MILGTGIDIIEISRIKHLLETDRFLKKMFTKNEIEYLKSKSSESTAGYFCAKEAVVKSMGTGFSGFNFTDIEILKINSAPHVKLHGKALEAANERGIGSILISISHCMEYANAIAIATSNKNEDYLLQNKSIEKSEIDTQNNYPMNLFKKRKSDSHKGDYGKIYIIGGCYHMSGAVILASRAALRSGAGLVTCVIPEGIINRVGSQIAEATYMVCHEGNGYIELSRPQMDEILFKADVIALGVGLGKTEKIKDSISYMIEKSRKPMVIDADGINMLCDIKEILKNTKSQIVLTPHTGEMSRLTHYDIEYINNNRVKAAKDFAAEYKCIVLLKGADTVVTDGKNVYTNTTGNPGMATGGSGDVLTGIIASLIGQGYKPYDAAVLGSYIHGKAGDSAYEKYGYGLTAGDMIDFLGIYLKG